VRRCSNSIGIEQISPVRSDLSNAVSTLKIVRRLGIAMFNSVSVAQQVRLLTIMVETGDE
jgi:hypothetical protein